MKLGVVFPQTEIGSDPIVIRDYAQAVEGMGFDHLLAYDHVLGAHPDRPGGWNRPYDWQTHFHEPLVLFGYLAGLTQRLELVTNIIILPQRQTVLVAKQAAEVDVLSGGRLRLGVGIGWNHVEYQGLNEDFSNRGRRIVEQVEVLRALWTNDVVDYTGRWHRIDKAAIRPLPVQRPIPIWFGGGAEQVLKRIGRIGDGWFPQIPVDQAAPALERLRAYTREAGRDVAEVGIEARAEPFRIGWEAVPDFISGWRDLGATHLSFNTMGMGFTSPQQHLDAVRRFQQTAADLGVQAEAASR